MIANEPTLACYRLGEHVRRSTPKLVERRIALTRNERLLEGRVFDLEYDLNAVKQIYPTEIRLLSLKETLKNAIFMKRELDKTAREREIAASMESRARLKKISASFIANAETRSLGRSSPMRKAAAYERNVKISPETQPRKNRSNFYFKMVTPTR